MSDHPFSERAAAELRRAARRAGNVLTEAAGLPDKRRALPRWVAFEALRWVTPVVAVDRDGLRYFVSTRDRSVGRIVFMTGAYDAELISTAVEVLGTVSGSAEPLRDRQVVDVGANIGTSLIPLVLQHGARGGLGIEPHPLNADLLQLNLAANGLRDRVRVARVAASDTDGSAELEISPGNAGDHRIRVAATPDIDLPADAYGESRRAVLTVPVQRLDAVIAAADIEPADVGLLWMDTQGHEGRVLAGAPDLLAAGVPVCTELWPYGLRRSGSLETLLELAAAHFTTAVDLRATSGSGGVVEVPARELSRLVDRYPAESYTDLLLVP